MKFLRPCLTLVSVIALCSLPGMAQSPASSFIRIQMARFGATNTPRPEEHSAVTVNRSQFTSRGGFVRSRITVTAPTARLARRAARHRAYARAVNVVALPLRQFQALADNLAEATSQLRETTRILSEKETPSGYQVEAEFTQSAAQLTQDVRSSGLSNFRLVVLLPETIDGQRVEAPTVETALVGALADAKFQVYDWNYVASQRPLLSLANTTLAGQQHAAADLGTRFLANIIVAGRVAATFSQDNNGIISYIATANLRAIRIDTGQILTAREYSEKGFGQDKAQASRQALQALAGTIAKDLPAELLAHDPEYHATVQLAQSDPQVVERAVQFLRNLPGVADVQQAQSGSGVQFAVTSKEKPVALGAQISSSRDYEVSGYGQQDGK